MAKGVRSKTLQRKVFLERSPALTQARIDGSFCQGHFDMYWSYRGCAGSSALLPSTAPQHRSQGPRLHVTPAPTEAPPGSITPEPPCHLTPKATSVTSWGSLHRSPARPRGPPDSHLGRMLEARVSAYTAIPLTSGKRFLSPSEEPRGEKPGNMCHPTGHLRELAEWPQPHPFLSRLLPSSLQCQRVPDFCCHCCWGPLPLTLAPELQKVRVCGSS